MKRIAEIEAEKRRDVMNAFADERVTEMTWYDEGRSSMYVHIVDKSSQKINKILIDADILRGIIENITGVAPLF